MSVTSCEMDCPGSSNGNDFCCTEEELFESFMEIVNDPELQGLASNEDQNTVDVKEGQSSSTDDVSSETSKEHLFTSDETRENKCNLIDTEDVVDQVERDDASDALDHNEAGLQESQENHTNENELNDSKNQVSEATDENLSTGENEHDIALQNGQETLNTEETSRKAESETVETLNNGGIAEHDSPVSLPGQGSVEVLSDISEKNENESNISTEENEQHSPSCDSREQNEDKTPELSLEPNPELNQSNADEINFVPSQQPSNQSKPEVISSILLRQPTSPRRIERESFSLNQPPTSPKEIERETSSNQPPTSPKQIKGEISSSNQPPTSPKQIKGEISSSNQPPTSPKQIKGETSSNQPPTSPKQIKGEISSSNQPPTSPKQIKGEISSSNQPPTSPKQIKGEISSSNQPPTSPKQIKGEISSSNQLPTSPKEIKGEISSSNQLPTSPKEIEKEISSSNQPPTSPKQIKGEIFSSNQPPTSPKRAEQESSTSFHQHPKIISSNLLRKPTSPKRPEPGSSLNTSEDVDSTNQNEAGLSSTNQDETGIGSTNQNELQSIEDSIEEGIRKANQVCEELNAITQRMSLSSDELLGDNDSDYQGTDENSLESFVEPGLDHDGKSQNSNILNSKPVSKHGESDTNYDRQSGDNEESNNVINHGGDDATVESKRPNSLPKLLVTSQGNNSLTPISADPAPQGTTPSSMDTTPLTSPPGISPTHLTHLKDDNPDRKASMSDSLDSSEGSLSGDTRSVGASPLENRGPFNWEILNTALGGTETDDDDSVYETSGNYGGFGLLLDDESTNNLAVDDVRYRSVSQSSTLSEVEFKKQFKEQNKTGSLDRNKDGVMCSGYLLKLGGTGITPKNWRKRWCVLRYDRCLYYYKTARDTVPCGIVVLANYIVSHSSEFNKKNCIKISKGGGRTYFFSSETSRDMLRWMEALRNAAENNDEGTNFVIREEIIHNVAIPALSIKKPDCHGYLTKQGAKSSRSWKRRYCVLKNGCLYYYREMADTTALGVAKLHGYTVEEVTPHGRRNGFRCVPPHSKMRTFTFIADNEYDKKRWIPCFQESIRVNTITDEN